MPDRFSSFYNNFRDQKAFDASLNGLIAQLFALKKGMLSPKSL